MVLIRCNISVQQLASRSFQKTAKVLNETVQSGWQVLCILGDRKNGAQKCAKTWEVEEQYKKWRWFCKLMNAENIAKRKKKAKTHWHGECHQLKCVPKPCVWHPMSIIWTPGTPERLWKLMLRSRNLPSLLGHPAVLFAGLRRSTLANLPGGRAHFLAISWLHLEWFKMGYTGNEWDIYNGWINGIWHPWIHPNVYIIHPNGI